jgi:hypothetical protein
LKEEKLPELLEYDSSDDDDNDDDDDDDDNDDDDDKNKNEEKDEEDDKDEQLNPTTQPTRPIQKNLTKRKGNRNRLTLELGEAAELFNSTPFFMGKWKTHGQQVHLAAIPCPEIDCSDRRWPNPRKEGKLGAQNTNSHTQQVYKYLHLIPNLPKLFPITAENVLRCGVNGFFVQANTDVYQTKNLLTASTNTVQWRFVALFMQTIPK